MNETYAVLHYRFAPLCILFLLLFRDVAQWSKYLQADTFQAVGLLHLLITEPATLRTMEETKSGILLHVNEISRSQDPLLPHIMHVHNKSCELYDQLCAYWKTTAEWASGIELDYDIDPVQSDAYIASPVSGTIEKLPNPGNAPKHQTDLKSINQRAKYNNHVNTLIKELETHMADLGIYPRLLAMESVYKEWVAQQIDDTLASDTPFITEAMLQLAEDPQVQTLVQLKKEVFHLLIRLNKYWQDTDDARSEYN
ncbi:MAG: hypothetical protein ACKVOR_13940 [Flavobacteriales bacterium]